LVAVAALVGLLFALARSDGTGENLEAEGADGSAPAEVEVRYVDDAPATTGKSRALIPAPTPPPSTLPVGQYLLGKPTGLWLFYGGQDPLQRLDLDSGEHIEVGARAIPVAVNGEDVVLYQPASGVFGWVLIEDPGEQSLAWRRGPVAPGPEPGQLWILDPQRDLAHPAGVAVGAGRWDLIDLATVRLLEQRPGDLYPEVEAQYSQRSARGLDIWAMRPPPDLSNRSSGVHRYEPDGYRRLQAGWVLTSSPTVALIQSCADGGDCGLSWLDPADGRAIDLPVPDGDLSAAELVAGGNWLRHVDTEGRVGFLNLGTGEKLSPPGVGARLSPDARWMATVGPDRVSVFDVSVGLVEPVMEIELFDQMDGGELLFVTR
jgi:hypothetical protein